MKIRESLQLFKWLGIIFAIMVSICVLDYSLFRRPIPRRLPAIKVGDFGHHVIILHDPELSLPKDITFSEHPTGVYRTEIRIRDKDEHDRAVKRVCDHIHDVKP